VRTQESIARIEVSSPGWTPPSQVAARETIMGMKWCSWGSEGTSRRPEPGACSLRRCSPGTHDDSAVPASGLAPRTRLCGTDSLARAPAAPEGGATPGNAWRWLPRGARRRPPSGGRWLPLVRVQTRPMADWRAFAAARRALGGGLASWLRAHTKAAREAAHTAQTPR